MTAPSCPVRTEQSVVGASHTNDPFHQATQVWWITLPLLSKYGGRLFQVLSPEERDRSSAFKSPRARDRYAITRAVLRVLLSQYTNQAPDGIYFRTSPCGKPFAVGESMPQFSVSHSEDIAVVALSHSPLGIDIEHVHEIPELLAIAKRYFLDSECDQLVRLPQARRVRALRNMDG